MPDAGHSLLADVGPELAETHRPLARSRDVVAHLQSPHAHRRRASRRLPSFFESKGHLRHPSGSLIPPAWDHTTLFTSAGMQPLMPYFLGREQPPAPLLTTVQKCFRTPDIDEVGLDGSHLTFFEMLGNFSFGQYFKEGAIEFAWEFVTEHLRIDTDRMWVTVFAGDGELGLGEDEAADRAVAAGRHARGAHRAARPRAQHLVGRRPGAVRAGLELFYDRGEALGCDRPDCAPGCECERYLEFWNLVFMEYELHADGKVTPLPKQNVDTGLGLERAASILQGVVSVYETDGYRSIMDWIAGESGVGPDESEQADESAPHPRRPRARDDVPGRGRRHPLERGPRLRPPPCDPPCRPAGAGDRAGAARGRSRTSSSSRWATGTPSCGEHREQATGASSGPRRSGSRGRSSAGSCCSRRSPRPARRSAARMRSGSTTRTGSRSS